MVEATEVQLYAAFGTFLVASFAGLSLFFNQRQLKKHIMAQTEIRFMEDYINIQKTKCDAIEKKSAPLGYQYYREMFDLHWTAHNLWKKKLIDDRVMRTWLDIRKRNFVDDDKLPIESTPDYPTSYRETWRKLTAADYNYFAPGDDFVALMEKVHDKNNHDIYKIMKEHKKCLFT